MENVLKQFESKKQKAPIQIFLPDDDDNSEENMKEDVDMTTSSPEKEDNIDGQDDEHMSIELKREPQDMSKIETVIEEVKMQDDENSDK